jgi:3-methyladenine DNA glycosylase AlkD
VTSAAEVVARLRALSSESERAGLGRYGIPSANALGVPMRAMKALGKELGRDHALALDLWASGLYEARTVAVFVADPARMDNATIDGWAADFDSWAICDTACFHLFDRAPGRWTRPAAWSSEEAEFVRRAGFALIWALALHDRDAPDAAFVEALALIETAPDDPRPLVRKAMDMALRAVGRRPGVRPLALETARRMARSAEAGRAWVGRTAAKGLSG